MKKKIDVIFYYIFVSVFPPSSSIPQDNNPKFLQVEAREFSSVS